MKTELDQSLDETSLSIESTPVKTCVSSNPATHVCYNKNCDNLAFICGDKSCQCDKEHGKCPQILILSILNAIKAKIIPLEHFHTSILNKIDKTIH